MRSYIFTSAERRRLEAWLNGARDEPTTLNIFVEVRRNLNGIKRDVELLSRIANRLSVEGRLMGRVKIKKERPQKSNG